MPAFARYRAAPVFRWGCLRLPGRMLTTGERLAFGGRIFQLSVMLPRPGVVVVLSL